MKFILALKIVFPSSTRKITVQPSITAVYHFLFLQPYKPCWKAIMLAFCSLVHDREKAACSPKNSRKSEWSMLIYYLFL